MAQIRIYTPKPRNIGEPQSVRDAYDAQLAEERQQREAAQESGQ
ncbi:hypothetical protein ACWEQG_38860 [Microbispora sp. NPDC004025]